jgi:hypothetical protein
MKAAIIGLSLLTIGCSLIVMAPHINAWEKANGYPFGQMCNSVFTLYVDTCGGVR